LPYRNNNDLVGRRSCDAPIDLVSGPGHSKIENGLAKDEWLFLYSKQALNAGFGAF
jgi:hypothetical protein